MYDWRQVTHASETHPESCHPFRESGAQGAESFFKIAL
jgi:hypothetical protein